WCRGLEHHDRAAFRALHFFAAHPERRREHRPARGTMLFAGFGETHGSDHAACVAMGPLKNAISSALSDGFANGAAFCGMAAGASGGSSSLLHMGILKFMRHCGHSAVLPSQRTST